MRDLLERIYDEHAQALFAFLLQLTRDEPATRDLLQDIFRKLAENPSLLDGARNERALLLRLARNRAIDLLRRNETRARYHSQSAAESPLFAPSTDPDEEMFRLRLHQALDALPREQREVVHLKLWEGLTFQEIAETLDTPLNAVTSRYRYGLDKLRSRLRLFYEEIR